MKNFRLFTPQITCIINELFVTVIVPLVPCTSGNICYNQAKHRIIILEITFFCRF